jgi:hypothetical protein
MLLLNTNVGFLFKAVSREICQTYIDREESENSYTKQTQMVKQENRSKHTKLIQWE